MGFLFWKKKKSSDAEAPTDAVVAKDEELVAVSAPAAEVTSEPQPELTLEPATLAEPDPRPEPEVAVEPEPSPEPETEPQPEPETETEPEPEVKLEPEVESQAEVEAPATSVEPELEAVELPKRTFKKGIRSLFSRIKFDPANLDELEDILIQADFGLDASIDIVSQVKSLAKQRGAETEAELKGILAEVIANSLEREDKALNLSDGKLPYVFLVVGVNGVGKTTTIGKLANWLSEGEWDVLIGAADTFRAAAVEQVATWAQRAGAQLVGPKTEGQDPASVAFEAVEQAISRQADIAIIDTAGRLQNKSDLMAELEKIRRVIEKQAQISEVLLVLDATTGQNGLQQAKVFAEVAKVTGVALTKLDGTAKGGIVFSIQRELGIPVKLVGVGEGVNDFAFFDAQEFAAGLIAEG